LSIAAGLLVLASAASAFAQDFNKSYPLAAGGTISIRNVSGDVIVTGYDGQQVVVTATKVGEDLDMVEVEDLSSGNQIDVRAKYPRNCRRCNVSLNFDVKVPRATRYGIGPISTASGNIKLMGVTGDVKVSTASGDVQVNEVSGDITASTASGEVDVRNVAGTVNASSASGNVEVEISRLEGAGDMKFSSASGDVNVRLPSSADADVRMSTASGRIQTNFPIEVREDRYGSGSRAEGRLGSGARSLRISTASGNVSLTSN
jgi:hypothetical protein